VVRVGVIGFVQVEHRHALVDQLQDLYRGNVLPTKNGLLLIDLETCCRGPVEFDVAHTPEEVSVHYPDVNHHLLRECQILVLAMIATWRWSWTPPTQSSAYRPTVVL
jgi:hypothetical protein